jgi:hypothetical protein
MAKDEVLMRAGEGGKSDHLLSGFEGQFQTVQRHKVEEWKRQQGVVLLQGRLKNLSNSFSRSTGCVLVETGTSL